jgi:hypothetical protein
MGMHELWLYTTLKFTSQSGNVYENAQNDQWKVSAP